MFQLYEAILLPVILFSSCDVVMFPDTFWFRWISPGTPPLDIRTVSLLLNSTKVPATSVQLKASAFVETAGKAKQYLDLSLDRNEFASV